MSKKKKGKQGHHNKYASASPGKRERDRGRARGGGPPSVQNPGTTQPVNIPQASARGESVTEEKPGAMPVEVIAEARPAATGALEQPRPSGSLPLVPVADLNDIF